MGTYIITGVLVVLFAAAIVKIRKDAKNGGCSGCSGSCGKNTDCKGKHS